ncbi:hypothetical protein [Clostridium tunisiense]|uniref:hypothetical protein n=1 Tax=Clostridium tunisiense TaxID=219748 RepID=UPI0002D8F6E1|nr:hypothetical protein [Clostridium tunisiense]
MSLLGLLFGKGKKIDKPIFVKEFSKQNKQLNDLEELCEKLSNSDKKELIE